MGAIKVDFSTTGESFERLSDGKYAVRVLSASVEEGTKAPYIKWELQVVKGEATGKKINHLTSLSPIALFSLRDTLVAMGVNVPKGAVSIDPAKFVGKTFGIEVNTRIVDDKSYANIKSVFSLTTSALPVSAPVEATSLGGVADTSIDEGEVVLTLGDDDLPF